MVDTFSLLYAFPQLEEYSIPCINAAGEPVREEAKHACSWTFDSNLTATRRLTGNPGLPAMPPPAVPGKQPSSRGMSDKIAMLSYLSNVFWAINGGTPAKPIPATFTQGVTSGSITYQEVPE